MRAKPRGLFITGSDTHVGKTCVAARLALALVAAGQRVGVYKPVASGCHYEGAELVSDDALALWQAAGRPGTLNQVCPQRFSAPLAPPAAARRQGEVVNGNLLRGGLEPWLSGSDIVLVEGAGGLLSPLADNCLVADFAARLFVEFGWPLVVVVANRLGAVNQALLTLAAAQARGGLPVAAVVLNETCPPVESDLSRSSNAADVARFSPNVPLTCLAWQAAQFEPPLDWWSLAGRAPFPAPKNPLAG